MDPMDVDDPAEGRSPASKRRRYDGPRAVRNANDPFVADFAGDFWDIMSDLRGDYSVTHSALQKAFRGDNQRLALLRGPVEDTVLTNTLVPESLLPSFQTLFNLQEDLISQMHVFMMEAADILGINRQLVEMNRSKVFKLAKDVDCLSLSDAELNEYVKSIQGPQFFLVLSPVGVEEQGVEALKIQESLEKYVSLAERIRANEDASKFVLEIWKGFQTCGENTFNALCVPSGTGKTQLAFTLPTEDCKVVYMNMCLIPSAADSPTTDHQRVYRNFEGYMTPLIEKLREDAIHFRGKKYSEWTKEPSWTNGIIVALMELLMDHPELDLPKDLRRLAIIDRMERMNTSQYNGASIVISPKRASEAKVAVGNLVKASGGKRVVFFVDEFAVSSHLSTGLDENALAFFRRSLMNTGACVVVASTDSGVMNMMRANAATPGSAGNQDVPWVKLCIRLPPYVADKTLEDSIKAIQDEGVRDLLKLCLKSRPRFADDFATKWLPGLLKDWSTTELLPDNEAQRAYLLDLLEQARGSLQKLLHEKATSLDEVGCVGYLMAMLTAGYRLDDADKRKRDILKNFSTKNWAYLVNERKLFIQNDQIKKKEKTKEEKEKKRMPRDVAAADPEWLFVELFRSSAKKKVHDLFYYVHGHGRLRFQCTTYFPDPDDDLLLYLVLGGTSQLPGLRVLETLGLSEGIHETSRLSAAKLWRSVFEQPKVRPAQAEEGAKPDSEGFEAMVCAAFMTAANAGEMEGCDLEEFLRRFVAELIDADERNYIELQEVAKVRWGGSFHSQFMLPFNTNLPVAVREKLGLAVESVRPPQSQKFDAGTIVRTGPGKNDYTSSACWR